MKRVEYAIRNFAGAAGILAAAFFVAEPGITTMLIIGIVAIIAGVCSFRIYNDLDGKRYGPYMLLYGGILVVASLICLGFEQSFGILKYVGAFAMGFASFFQWIKIANIFGTTKLLRRIEGLAILGFPALIIVGVILSVFTQQLSLGKSLIISGGAIWAIHTIYALVLMDSEGEPDSSKFKFDARKSTYNFDKNKILDEDDVIQVIHSVAAHWDRYDSLPHGASVKYYVYEEVRGNYVTYTISGTLRETLLMPDNQKFEVQSALQNKLKQMQQGIIKMTQRELSKYKQLPYPTYDINVEIGIFDE